MCSLLPSSITPGVLAVWCLMWNRNSSHELSSLQPFAPKVTSQVSGWFDSVEVALFQLWKTLTWIPFICPWPYVTLQLKATGPLPLTKTLTKTFEIIVSFVRRSKLRAKVILTTKFQLKLIFGRTLWGPKVHLSADQSRTTWCQIQKHKCLWFSVCFKMRLTLLKDYISDYYYLFTDFSFFWFYLKLAQSWYLNQPPSESTVALSFL